MSRDFEFDKRDSEQRDTREPASRMALSQGRGGGSETEQGHRRRQADEATLAAVRLLVEDAAQGRPTVSEFLDRLEERGVRPIASVQSNGRWNGIVYEYVHLRIKGSHLGRSYTATGLRERRGIRYDPSRDDQQLARTNPSVAHFLRPWQDFRSPEFNSLDRANRSRDLYGLSPAQLTVMWDVGRFRTIETADLQKVRYPDRPGVLQNDLKHLISGRYLKRRSVPIDGRGRSLDVLALTRRGRSLLNRANRDSGDGSQVVYGDFVKPREIAHDAALYRMYQAEAARIERDGGKVQRVVLDYELKKKAYSPLAKGHHLPPFEYAERQQAIAKENGLPVIDGHITLPDLRIEYQTADGEDRHIDLELATRNYRAAHVRSKASAGFRVYADPSSNSLAGVLDDHDVIAELLDM